jgi:hypothetical protein
MGFCLFNNVAVAAQLAIADLGVRRVFILDWDVHHGNGTAEIFRRRDDVLFASIHQAGIFPGGGALADAGSGPGFGYTINLPVHAGADGAAWLPLLEHVVLPVARVFGPELVLIWPGLTPIAMTRSPTAGSAATISRTWPATCAISHGASARPWGLSWGGLSRALSRRWCDLDDARARRRR